MLAFRAALAAYRDGWARVLHAPWLLVGLTAAAIAIVLPGVWDSGELGWRAATVAGDVTMVIGGAIETSVDTWEFADRGREPSTWLLTIAALVVGTFLAGGILDRYARQRPLDARTFWGMSGELAGRLLRLHALAALALLAIEALLAWVPTGFVGSVGVGEATYSPPTIELRDFLRFPLALAVLAFVDAARVRLVVERRRSVIFAVVAGARYLRRHATTVACLYALLLATEAVVLLLVAVLALAASVAVAGDEGFAYASQLLSAGLVLPALLSGASLTALFQATLAHAAYVAPPRLVWPDSPAVETLGERRDFPPAV
jgi:hypothetical protein